MDYRVTLSPSGKQLDVERESTILDAAVKANLNLPHGCRDGSCGQCKSRLLNGQVNQPRSLGGISDEEVAQGYILTCVAKPTSDLEIESTYFPELDGIEPRIFPCKADGIEFPSDEIAILRLRLPPGSSLKYLPGQYIELSLKGVSRSYSIANANQGRGLELHIRRFPGGVFSEFVFEKLKPGTLLRLHGPHGTFFVRESDAPILFLAGGTGFAPVKAMVERLIENRSDRAIHIYWGISSVDTFYSALPDMWQNTYKNITFTPVLSVDDTTWEGKRGLVHNIVLDDFPNLSPFEVYACGSLEMLKAAKSDFLRQGLLEKNFVADAFTPFIQAT